MNTRQLFLQHVAQTSDMPLALEPTHAKGVYIFDKAGKKYIDLISGISVSSLGHSHPKIVAAVKEQAEKYMHLMVYGEFVEAPQVQLAQAICAHLPENLESVYFTSSGTEATEGALKVAKRYTGRSEVVHFKDSYHGSTMGALSVIGDEYFKSNYRPLVPGSRMLHYGSTEELEQITEETAAVIMEPVQAESGVTVPPAGYLKAVQKRCNEVGALFILDEIQTGMGRTGKLYHLLEAGVEPDIVLTAKAFGGGMPLGAFISSRKIFEVIQDNPFLGHITTFGGHPVSCAAGYAALQIIEEEKLLDTVEEKGRLFEDLLKHPNILKSNRSGLLMALHFDTFENNKAIIDLCIQDGLITDWFLFEPRCLRIAPSLTISKSEIEMSCEIILRNINKVFEA